jgi:hypothetical protein
MKLVTSFVSLAGLAACCMAQNMVVNGSFESNTATATIFNMQNAAFSATVNGANAFGGSNELDLVTGTAFGIAPQDGDWKVGLHQRTDDPAHVDAFSMQLSSNVVSGNSYTLSVWAAQLTGSVGGEFEIGLSNDAGDFGTLVLSGTAPSPSDWTSFNLNFVAGTNAAFITVRSTTSAGEYVCIDNLSLEAVPAPGTLAMLGLSVVAVGRRRR